MIDIIRFSDQLFDLGFSKVYHVNEFRISSGKPRAIIEQGNYDIIVSVEKHGIKTSLKHIDSGLDYVICKLAHQKKVAIAFSFYDMLNSRNKVEHISKVIQNIRLCRKYKVQMVLASFAKNKYEMRNAYDLYSLALSLGMTAKEAKSALNYKRKEEIGIQLIKEDEQTI